jgi:predicted AlkP superfamily phosphohydrolase/phosphomutase
MLGEAMAHLPPDAYLVFGSDHGIAPLNVEVRLNNLFEQKGWLKFKRDDEGTLHVDWDNTKVVFLQSYHVYVNPAGLGDAYNPPSGPEYDKLLAEVQKLLIDLKDSDGTPAFMHVLRRSQVEEKMGLPADRVGDLVLSFRLGYCAVEDMSEDHLIFVEPIKSGYKQGLMPSENRQLWTPFMIMGPGIKAGYEIPTPISHLDQYPLIMNRLKVPDAPPMKNEELKKILND